MKSEEFLSIREFAKQYEMKEAKIRKLVEEGKIPAVRKGRQWKIDIRNINAWLAINIKSMTNENLANIEVDSKNKTIKIAPLLNKQNIIINPAAYNKNQILQELVNRLAIIKRLNENQKSLLLNAVIMRERLCSTAISDGIAVPHPRNAMPEIVDKPYIILAISKYGIDFEADDGEKTKLFFFLCAPRNDIHLKIMARLSRLLRDPVFRYKLTEIASQKNMPNDKKIDSVIKVFKEFEKNLDKKIKR